MGDIPDKRASADPVDLLPPSPMLLASCSCWRSITRTISGTVSAEHPPEPLLERLRVHRLHHLVLADHALGRDHVAEIRAFELHP